MSSDPEESATDFSIQESDGFTEAPEDAADRLPDAVRIVAEQMVSAALAVEPGLQERSAAAGAIIVLRAPAAWSEAVAAAWGASVLGFPFMDWGSAPSNWARGKDKGPLLTYLRETSGARPSEVRSAMRAGRGILAVAEEGVEPRSRILVRSADADVAIGPPTPAMLAAAAEAAGLRACRFPSSRGCRRRRSGSPGLRNPTRPDCGGLPRAHRARRVGGR